MMLKKKFWIGILAGCALLLTACSTKSPTEQDLINQLPREVLQFRIDAEQYDSKATKLTIEKQQTNDKSDIAYCQVVCESDVLDRTLYLILYSSYDKNQWKVNRVEEYQDAQLTIKKAPVTLEEGKTKVINAGYTGIIDTEDRSDLANGQYSYQYTVYEDYANLTIEGTAWVGGSIMANGLGEYSWQDDSWNDIQNNWKINGTWKDSAGKTISIEDCGTYYKMTYGFAYTDGSRGTATGKRKKESVEKDNAGFDKSEEYWIRIDTAEETGGRYNSFIGLFPETAWGGTGYSQETMKRIG